MLVKFLREEKVLDGSGKIRQHFLAGQVVELSTASARHWLNREAVTRVSGSVPTFAPKAEVMPDPKEEPVKRRPGRPRKAENGASLASGQESPSASSAEAPASPESKLTTSEGDAESSPSTTHTFSRRGPMSYTPATPLGGESTETPLDSED